MSWRSRFTVMIDMHIIVRVIEVITKLLLKLNLHTCKVVRSFLKYIFLYIYISIIY